MYLEARALSVTARARGPRRRRSRPGPARAALHLLRPELRPHALLRRREDAVGVHVHVHEVRLDLHKHGERVTRYALADY